MGLSYLPEVAILLQPAPSPRFVFLACADPQHVRNEFESRVPLVSLGRVFSGDFRGFGE